MNYIKIYENFLDDRSKLLSNIEKINSEIKEVDDKMLDKILDLIPDILEINYLNEDKRIEKFDYNFAYENDIKAYKFVLGLRNVYTSRIREFFDKYIKVFQSDLYRIDTLSNDYKIEYIFQYNNSLHKYLDNSFIKSLSVKFESPNGDVMYHSNIYNFQYLTILFFKK